MIFFIRGNPKVGSIQLRQPPYEALNFCSEVPSQYYHVEEIFKLWCLPDNMQTFYANSFVVQQLGKHAHILTMCTLITVVTSMISLVVCLLIIPLT